MVKRRHLLIGFLILLGGILLWKILFPSEEKRVIQRFELLSRYTEKKANEDILSTANRIKNLSQLFANPCEFKIEGDPFYSFTGSYSREEIGGYALRGRSYFLDLSLNFSDYKIKFSDRETAQVQLIGRLTGKTTAGERVDEVRELLCMLKKIEKAWLIARLEVVEVLKR
jgi:hypothetical protein